MPIFKEFNIPKRTCRNYFNNIPPLATFENSDSGYMYDLNFKIKTLGQLDYLYHMIEHCSNYLRNIVKDFDINLNKIQNILKINETNPETNQINLLNEGIYGIVIIMIIQIDRNDDSTYKTDLMNGGFYPIPSDYALYISPYIII